MSERVTSSTIEFRRPFRLSALDASQPAGTYRIDSYEELVEGLSFAAYRRIETLLHLHGTEWPAQLVAVDPLELEEAQRRDATDGGSE